MPGKHVEMLLALWIVVSRMLIIFAVLGVLFVAVIILNKSIRPPKKEEEKDKP